MLSTTSFRVKVALEGSSDSGKICLSNLILLQDGCNRTLYISKCDVLIVEAKPVYFNDFFAVKCVF